MFSSTSHKLRLWEAALLLAFGLTLTAGVWASASEGALAGQVLRLHVVANSDSEEDQALKLLARDAVLELASQLLDGVSDRAQAEEILSAHLDELAQAGAEALAAQGCSDPVTAEIADQWFPTREYATFSLPAGQYRALRITSLFYFGLGMIYVPRGLLNGCGDTAFSMINGITEVACRIGYSQILLRIPILGYWSVWITTGLTWITVATVCMIRYLSGKWRQKGLVQARELS